MSKAELLRWLRSKEITQVYVWVDLTKHDGANIPVSKATMIREITAHADDTVFDADVLYSELFIG